jgi:hypothetical protein
MKSNQSFFFELSTVQARANERRAKYNMTTLQFLLLVFRALDVILRICRHGHGIMMLHLVFNARVDIAAGEFLDPDRNDTARWNNPRLLSVEISGDNTVSCQFPDSQRDPVEENVRCDTSNDTICDARRQSQNQSYIKKGTIHLLER